jgi:hypothetical protein
MAAHRRWWVLLPLFVALHCCMAYPGDHPSADVTHDELDSAPKYPLSFVVKATSSPSRTADDVAISINVPYFLTAVASERELQLNLASSSQALREDRALAGTDELKAIDAAIAEAEMVEAETPGVRYVWHVNGEAHAGRTVGPVSG